MTSEKQILANRANGLRSTGPRTEKGKRIASRNAVTHGLLAGDILIKGESTDQYEVFRDHLRTDLDPCGQLEALLAERIIAFFWRLARAGRMEQGLLDLLSENSEKKETQGSLPFNVVIRKTYTHLSDDPEYQEFLKYQQQGGSVPQEPCPPLNSELSAAPVPVEAAEETKEALGRIVRSDFSGRSLLERLLRYEGQIERSLYRALAELQKLQYIRKRNEAILVSEDTAGVNPGIQTETEPLWESLTPERE